MTEEERKLWYLFLRDYPVRFLRQKVIDKYIVDFYCAKARLVIELDGSQHYQEKEEKKDGERDACLKARRLEILRFSNLEVNQKFSSVCEYIDQMVKARVGGK